MHRPITAGLPAGAIEHDPLTIEAIEGAQAEVSMALDVRHAHATLIDPLHQRSRGGDLIDRVVVKIQGFRQGAANQMADAVARAFSQGVQRVPETIANGDVQVVTARMLRAHRNLSG